MQPIHSWPARSRLWKVRRSLACSLHDVASIIGGELTERDLLDTFELFLHDIDEVRSGVIQKMSAFLGILSPGCRESFLPVMAEVLRDQGRGNWRFRRMMAAQLSDFSILFSLCCDIFSHRIAALQDASWTTFPKSVLQSSRRRLSSKPVEQGGGCGLVRAACDQNHRAACSFRRVPAALILCEDMSAHYQCRRFCKGAARSVSEAYASNTALARATPSNVRVAVADTLNSAPSWLLEGESVINTLDTLRNDGDRDVAFAAAASK